jgi:hypothetical protein
MEKTFENVSELIAFLQTLPPDAATLNTGGEYLDVKVGGPYEETDVEFS